MPTWTASYVRSYGPNGLNTPPVFQGFRSQAGKEMILVLPGSAIRKLSDAEMGVYRRPFEVAGVDRRPILTWPRTIPIEGEPPDVVKVVSEYANWLEDSPREIGAAIANFLQRCRPS